MHKSIFAALIGLIFHSCSQGQSGTGERNLLSAQEFNDKIQLEPSALVLDVRTPGEFSKGHLENAVNFNWKGSEFDQQIAQIDKSIPVFVYCLSGGRSASAAHKMRSEGFIHVYELDGGIIKWRAANLPESTQSPAEASGMNMEQFASLLNSDKLVLIDFYADWCAPCKKMKPYLDEISRDMADKVEVVRINADDHKVLCRELGVNALPVLQLYKNQSLAWANTGFIDKDAVVQQILKLDQP